MFACLYACRYIDDNCYYYYVSIYLIRLRKCFADNCYYYYVSIYLIRLRKCFAVKRVMQQCDRNEVLSVAFCCVILQILPLSRVLGFRHIRAWVYRRVAIRPCVCMCHYVWMSHHIYNIQYIIYITYICIYHL